MTDSVTSTRKHTAAKNRICEKENAPELSWCSSTRFEGDCRKPNPTNGTNMHIVPRPPTSAEVLSSLKNKNDGVHTVLASTKRGTFTARVHRYDFLDGLEPCEGTTEIFIDNSEQDGGDSFHDLTVLWNQRNTFANTVADMIAAAAAVDEFKIVRDRAAGGEWYPAGTKGTPSLIPAAGGTEVFCGTTWQETADGRVSAPTLSVHVGSQAFEPEQALKFAVQLIQEAGRAMRIRALVQEQAQQGGAA